jgi:threonine dehydrogenase-like Zn-dependent dehydrogenase
MRAPSVAPNIANSARVDDIPEPPATHGAVRARALALGVCGTDREIVSGTYGRAPRGEKRLVIDHESFGRMQQAPAGCGVAGDLVVGIVCRPDPVPCPACAVGVLGRTASGVVCLVGVSAPDYNNRTMVLDTDTVFGSVNANRKHYEDAVDALKRADKDWVARIITRRVPVEQWTQPLEQQPDDIKVVIDFS